MCVRIARGAFDLAPGIAVSVDDADEGRMRVAAAFPDLKRDLVDSVG
jgi:hypothetical protein